MTAAYHIPSGVIYLCIGLLLGYALARRLCADSNGSEAAALPVDVGELGSHEHSEPQTFPQVLKKGA